VVLGARGAERGEAEDEHERPREPAQAATPPTRACPGKETLTGNRRNVMGLVPPREAGWGSKEAGAVAAAFGFNGAP
jgi:hypothetical protein